MLTLTQIRWAARHDWFVGARDDGSVLVCEVWTNINDGSTGEDYLTFYDFQDLRAWAGY